MTCFWDSIIRGLYPDYRYTHHSLIEYLKKNNTLQILVLINGNGLSNQQIGENNEAVNIYDIRSIFGGYWCSSCDPFLILVCNTFQINIIHKLLNTTIDYTINNPKFTILLNSNYSHMSFQGRKK